MMNGKCRNNIQPSQRCQFGMFQPRNFFSPITASVGNWIQNTANMFLDTTHCSPRQNTRNFVTNSTQLNKPNEAYFNVKPYTTTVINFDNLNSSMDFKPNCKQQNKNSGFSQEMNGIGHSNNKTNFKSDCDEIVENSHFNYNRNNKFHRMGTRDNNRYGRNGYNKRGYKSSEKHNSTVSDKPEYSVQRNNQHRNFKSNINKLKLENKSSNKNNNNNRTTEVVAIFTLEDFPELPVPKRHEPWSFKFPGSCQSQNHITAKLMNKNNPESASKIEPSTSRNCRQFSKDQNDINLPPSDKHDFIEDNFVIIMDRNSPQFNKHNSSSTAGYTPFKPRQRQISECSDDSFIICFTNDAADGVIEFTNLLTSDDDDDDDDDSESDDDISEHSENNSQLKQNNNVPKIKTENIKPVNKHLDTSAAESTSQPDSGFDDIKDKKIKKKRRVIIDLEKSSK